MADSKAIGEQRKQVLAEVKIKLETSIAQYNERTEHEFENEAMAYFVFCRYRDVSAWPNEKISNLGRKVVWIHD